MLAQVLCVSTGKETSGQTHVSLVCMWVILIIQMNPFPYGTSILICTTSMETVFVWGYSCREIVTCSYEVNACIEYILIVLLVKIIGNERQKVQVCICITTASIVVFFNQVCVYNILLLLRKSLLHTVTL